MQSIGLVHGLRCNGTIYTGEKAKICTFYYSGTIIVHMDCAWNLAINFLACFGPFFTWFGPFLNIFYIFWPNFGHIWSDLGQFRPVLGHFRQISGRLGPILGILGLDLGLCRGIRAQIWAISGGSAPGCEPISWIGAWIWAISGLFWDLWPGFGPFWGVPNLILGLFSGVGAWMKSERSGAGYGPFRAYLFGPGRGFDSFSLFWWAWGCFWTIWDFKYLGS